AWRYLRHFYRHIRADRLGGLISHVIVKSEPRFRPRTGPPRSGRQIFFQREEPNIEMPNHTRNPTIHHISAIPTRQIGFARPAPSRSDPCPPLPPRPRPPAFSGEP